MPFKRRPPSEQLDIRDKLDAERALHNNFGYHEFDLFAKLNIPKPVIGRIMNVSKNTIYDWLDKREALLKSEAGEL